MLVTSDKIYYVNSDQVSPPGSPMNGTGTIGSQSRDKAFGRGAGDRIVGLLGYGYV